MKEGTLYRKWRPQNFSEVVGQQHVVQTLANAIEAGKVSHAYLFIGSRGTGKTSVARILAKSLNCEDGPTITPCENCQPCQQIKAGKFLDVIEIDAASNRGIDDVRALKEQLYYSPSQGRYKVYIIDEVHMLTPEAFNALLKVLEEPPSKTVFILATTEAHKVLPTVLSRCQRFDFRRLAPEEIVAHLRKIAREEGIGVEESALWAISSFAQGSLRDAIVLLEQGAFYSPQGLREEDVFFLLGKSPESTLETLVELVLTGNLSGFLNLTEELYLKGYSFKSTLGELIDYLYSLLLKQEAGIEPKIYLSVSKFKNKFTSFQISEMMEVLSEAIAALRYQENPRLIWESAFFRIFRLRGFCAEEKIKKIEPERRTEKEEKTVSEGNQDKVDLPSEASDLRSSLSEDEPILAREEARKDRSFLSPQTWEKVLKELRDQKPSLYYMLLSAELVFEENDTICLSFKPEDHFQFKEISSQPNLERVENVYYQVTGKKVKIRCLLADEKETKKEKNKLKKERVISFLKDFEAEPILNPEEEGSL